jgi:transposase
MSRSLTDDEWREVAHTLEAAKASCHRDPRLRGIVDAVLWMSEHDTSWSNLPTHFPPAATCYGAYYRWRKDGLIQPILAALGMKEPVAQAAGARPRTVKPAPDDAPASLDDWMKQRKS